MRALASQLFPPRPAHTLDALRERARRALPAMVFDYVDGAAGDGAAEAANRAALASVRLRQRVLRDVRRRDLSSTVFGRPAGLPFGIAPMGFCGLVRPDADLMLARLAARLGIPVGLSTAATAPLEKAAEAAEGRAWFQLYHSDNAALVAMLLERAQAAGCEALVFTVDVPEVGRRPREMAQNFALPFRPSLRQMADCARRPGWTARMLAAPTPTLANFGGPHPVFDRKASRAGADFDTLARLRERWRGRLVVKGVLDPEDADRLAGLGVDAIQVSSHGGRQLGALPLPVEALPAIVRAVGSRAAVFYDSGLRSGEDVLRVHALGAAFAFIGRPFLYAIAAGGERGLDELVAILHGEIDSGLAILGCRSLAELRTAPLDRTDSLPHPHPDTRED